MTRTLATLAALLAALLFAGPVAMAQPGADQPAEPPPPQPLPGAGAPAPVPVEPAPPPPPLVAPARLAPRYAVVMTPEERDLVVRGEISKGRWIAGGVVAYAAGFGIGHAVQGRWADQGWIYTVGEAASLAVFFYSLDRCFNFDGCDLTLASLGVFGAVRVWELVDAWVAPHLHNKRVRRVRAKYNLERAAIPYHARFHLAPVGGGGMTGGVSLRF